VSLYGTMKKHHRIASEVREQILRRIKDEGVTIGEAARDAGVHETTVYGWLGKGVSGAPTIGELVKLKRQNEELIALVGQLTLEKSRAQKKSL
jgi:excisionase family DNA binding protein